MGVFRSEEMTYCKIRIPTESANDIMVALGSMENAIEFIDLTKDDIDAKKTYGSVVKRCEEMIGKISDLERIAEEFNQPMASYTRFSDFERDIKEDKSKRDKKFGSTYFDLIETEVFDYDKKIKDLTNSHAEIRDDLIGLIEKRSVIKQYKQLTDLMNGKSSVVSMSNKKEDMKPPKSDNIIALDIDEASDANEERDSQVNASRSGIMKSLNFITGVIKATDEMRFKKMVFRVSKGIAIISIYDLIYNIEESLFTKSIRQRGFTFADHREFHSSSDLIALSNRIKYSNDGGGGIKDKKKIFIIVIPGGEGKYLEGKLLDVCDIFQVSRYNMPNENSLMSEIDRIDSEFSDKKEILVRVEGSIKDILLHSMSAFNKKYSNFALYKLYFAQEKLIYYTMNKCLMHDNFIDGEVWIPTNKLEDVKNTLKGMSYKNEDKINANLTIIDNKSDDRSNNSREPPTLILTNEFMFPFQKIVNTYGIPSYLEVNPAFFNVISFPFLFGLMFGDIGHGFIVFIFSIYLCTYKGKSIKEGSIMEILFNSRYILLLMGVFSLFCGICYNEFFSIPFQFHSCYQLVPEKEHYIRIPNCEYVLGFDPKWITADNELTYGNSFKMKFSVIIGVLQMTFGIIIRGINAAYNHNCGEFFFKFIPQLIFMLVLFGYMNVLIIIKWCTNWENTSHLAPDIKSMLMDIFLKMGKVSYPLWGGAGVQERFHFAIIFICIACIVFMFLPTTLLNYFRAKKQYNLAHGNVENLNQPLNNDNSEDFDHYSHQQNHPPLFSDFMVNELINTIEFVLGSISNTASYLRLWALSLAHTQLGKVFLEQTILSNFFSSSDENVKDLWVVQFIKILVMYVIWSYFTIGVVLFMDMLECFLHTLRLHWVEFQGKFFKAGGYLFSPFSFNLMLKKD